MISYFILVAIAYTSFIHTMESPEPPSYVMLKDKNRKHVATISPAEYELLKVINNQIKVRPRERSEGGLLVEYGVITGLIEQEIILLIQAIKDHQSFYKAIINGLINLENTTRNQLKQLGLNAEFVDNLLVIITKDNKHVPVKKNVITYFFQTINHTVQEFPDSLTIDIPINAFDLITLYTFLSDFDMPTTIDYIAWLNRFAQTWVMATKSLSSDRNQLFSLLKTAVYLEAKSYLILGFYLCYKDLFKLDQAGWQAQENQNQFLMQIPSTVIREYPEHSIELLLKFGLMDKFFIKNDISYYKKIYPEGTISGNLIYSLKQLSSIPGIDQCTTLCIKNTNITKIGTDDINILKNVKVLKVVENRNLTTLEDNCLNMPNLTRVEFYKNNIPEIRPNVFVNLNLINLIFVENNIRTIKADWGAQVRKILHLDFNEPTLTTVEEGWLNGMVNKLDTIHLDESTNLNTATQIKIDVEVMKKTNNTTEPKIQFEQVRFKNLVFKGI